MELPDINEILEIGKGKIVKEGNKIAILNFGARLHECLKAAKKLEVKGISTTIADARFVKPLDKVAYRSELPAVPKVPDRTAPNKRQRNNEQHVAWRKFLPFLLGFSAQMSDHKAKNNKGRNERDQREIGGKVAEPPTKRAPIECGLDLENIGDQDDHLLIDNLQSILCVPEGHHLQRVKSPPLGKEIECDEDNTDDKEQNNHPLVSLEAHPLSKSLEAAGNPFRRKVLRKYRFRKAILSWSCRYFEIETGFFQEGPRARDGGEPAGRRAARPVAPETRCRGSRTRKAPGWPGRESPGLHGAAQPAN